MTKGIGDSFAIALLTTLWGAVVAYVIAKPWAEKLEGYSNTDMLINQLILEGCLLIKSNTNPRLIADRLSSRLATKAQEMAKTQPKQRRTNFGRIYFQPSSSTASDRVSESTEEAVRSNPHLSRRRGIPAQARPLPGWPRSQIWEPCSWPYACLYWLIRR